MKKVCIATSRAIGLKCVAWAQDNTPAGFELTDDIAIANIIICVKITSYFCYFFPAQAEAKHADLARSQAN